MIYIETQKLINGVVNKGGKVYIGKYGLDPLIAENKLTVYLSDDTALSGFGLTLNFNSDVVVNGKGVGIYAKEGYSLQFIDADGATYPKDFINVTLPLDDQTSKDFVKTLTPETDNITITDDGDGNYQIGVEYEPFTQIADIEEAKNAAANVGDFVETYAYTESLEVGGARYKVVEGGTGVDDGGSYIDMANGNQLELIDAWPLDVARFGAIPDGTTDNLVFIQKAFAYLKSKGGNTSIIFQGLGPFNFSDELLVDFSNIEIIIKTGLQLTKVTESSGLRIAGVDSDNEIENITVTFSDNGYIDGNGSNMPVGQIVSGDYHSLMLDHVVNYTINNIQVRNGLVNSCQIRASRNGKVIGGDVKGAVNNNGFSVSQDSENYSATNPNTWANCSIFGVNSYDNEDYGLTAFNASNVWFIGCKTWGNGTDNSPHGTDGLAGGGYSYEDSAGTPNVKNYKGGFIGCTSSYDQNRGFFITGDGITIDSACSAQNVFLLGDPVSLPEGSGTGYVIYNASNVSLSGRVLDCERSGIYLNGSEDNKPEIKLDVKIEGCGRFGVYGQGVVYVGGFVNVKNCGVGQSAAYAAFSISNGSLNPDLGAVYISGYFEDNGGQPITINRVAEAYVTNVKGKNNSLDDTTNPGQRAVQVSGAIRAIVSDIDMTEPYLGYVVGLGGNVDNGGAYNITGSAINGLILNQAAAKISPLGDLSATATTAQVIDALDAAGYVTKV